MVEGERIYGDGVNIAARMEGLAEGGGICISGTVFDHIKGKISVTFEDLGPQQVKNITEPIRAYRAVLSSGTVSARPQQKVVQRQDHRETSDLYNRLMTRVSPLLCRGIEDVLQRRKTTYNPGGLLNFGVLAPINGFYRMVGATIPTEHPSRQNSSKVGEGTRGFFTERKVAGYVRPSRLDHPTSAQDLDNHCKTPQYHKSSKGTPYQAAIGYPTDQALGERAWTNTLQD